MHNQTKNINYNNDITCIQISIKELLKEREENKVPYTMLGNQSTKNMKNLTKKSYLLKNKRI